MDKRDASRDNKTSSSSRTTSSDVDKSQRQKLKRDVCHEVIRKLRSVGHPALQNAGFPDELVDHFQRLPTR